MTIPEYHTEESKAFHYLITFTHTRKENLTEGYLKLQDLFQDRIENLESVQRESTTGNFFSSWLQRGVLDVWIRAGHDWKQQGVIARGIAAHQPPVSHKRVRFCQSAHSFLSKGTLKTGKLEFEAQTQVHFCFGGCNFLTVTHRIQG